MHNGQRSNPIPGSFTLDAGVKVTTGYARPGN